MKKLISLACCLVLALAITAGCKKKEEAPVVEPAKTEAPVQAPMTAKSAPVAPAAPAEKK